MAIPDSHPQSMKLRDWSLITGRGAKKRERGTCELVKFYPTKRGMAEKVSAMLKGGIRGFGVRFMQ